MRELVIAGNWKMNTLPSEGVELAKSVVNLTSKSSSNVIVVLCPPATHLKDIVQATTDTHISVGAQNVHWEKSGAYTGEISAEMLLALGVKWVIIGHSERRKYFGETDTTVNMRAKRALQAGLRPIVCLGETLEERQSGKTFEVLKRQVKLGLDGLKLTGYGGLVIAYEPVWAIGTGVNATPEQAQEAHLFIRNIIKENFSEEISQQTVIQYGGSVTDQNAKDLLECPDVDGALVGGASLKAEVFSRIVKAGEDAINRR